MEWSTSILVRRRRAPNGWNGMIGQTSGLTNLRANCPSGTRCMQCFDLVTCSTILRPVDLRRWSRSATIAADRHCHQNGDMI